MRHDCWLAELASGRGTHGFNFDLMIAQRAVVAGVVDPGDLENPRTGLRRGQLHRTTPSARSAQPRLGEGSPLRGTEMAVRLFGGDDRTAHGLISCLGNPAFYPRNPWLTPCLIPFQTNPPIRFNHGLLG